MNNSKGIKSTVNAALVAQPAASKNSVKPLKNENSLKETPKQVVKNADAKKEDANNNRQKNKSDTKGNNNTETTSETKVNKNNRVNSASKESPAQPAKKENPAQSAKKESPTMSAKKESPTMSAKKESPAQPPKKENLHPKQKESPVKEASVKKLKAQENNVGSKREDSAPKGQDKQAVPSPNHQLKQQNNIENHIGNKKNSAKNVEVKNAPETNNKQALTKKIASPVKEKQQEVISTLFTGVFRKSDPGNNLIRNLSARDSNLL